MLHTFTFHSNIPARIATKKRYSYNRFFYSVFHNVCFSRITYLLLFLILSAYFLEAVLNFSKKFFLA